MNRNVAVRVRHYSGVMIDANAAHHYCVTGTETMNIETVADSNIQCSSTAMIRSA